MDPHMFDGLPLVGLVFIFSAFLVGIFLGWVFF
jgi:hypothetical protein